MMNISKYIRERNSLICVPGERTHEQWNKFQIQTPLTNSWLSANDIHLCVAVTARVIKVFGCMDPRASSVS